jgi:hypothetical protein
MPKIPKQRRQKNVQLKEPLHVSRIVARDRAGSQTPIAAIGKRGDHSPKRLMREMV